MKRALQVVLAISVFGMMFSGTLTYREIFAKTAAVCPSPGAPGTILGYPACVYGLLMYTLIAMIAGMGLWAGRAARSGPSSVAASAPQGTSV
ncbi:MAG TPA: hypothetical protein VIP11_13860 [Gemmatimonadaceae bacterium]